MKKLLLLIYTIIFICSNKSIAFELCDEKIFYGSSNYFALFQIYITPDKTYVYKQNSLGKFVPLTGNISQMSKFFEALKRANNRVIRIAHYGDSLIQGDIISDNLREKFQETFGGRGVGFLSIVSNDIRMRPTTKHTFSDDWEYVSIVTRNAKQLPHGISGSVAVPKPNSWVKYETQDFLKSSSSFKKVNVYYSHADEDSQIEYSINNSITKRVTLNSSISVQQLEINTNTESINFTLKFISGKAPFFYGVSLETDNGVYLDNFPMPGNTGSSLLEIPKNILQDFSRLNGYNLIILTYGANVSSPNKGIYELYENKMTTVIEQFKSVFPNASFLMVGVGDKTVKRGNQFVTNPDVEYLLNAQKKIVERTQIAFWNLWEAMGGKNSMAEWVNFAPPMALRDYSHFTHLGGERVARLLFDAILDSYNRYVK